MIRLILATLAVLFSAPVLADCTVPAGNQTIYQISGATAGFKPCGIRAFVAAVGLINPSPDIWLGARAVTATTDTITANDLGTTITYTNASGVAVALPQAQTTQPQTSYGNGTNSPNVFYTGWYVYMRNIHASSSVTITPTTSTINGAASLTLQAGQSAMIWANAGNYQAAKSITGITLPLSGTVPELGSNQIWTGSNTWTLAGGPGIFQIETNTLNFSNNAQTNYFQLVYSGATLGFNAVGTAPFSMFSTTGGFTFRTTGKDPAASLANAGTASFYQAISVGDAGNGVAALTLTMGAVGLTKMTASASAPGATGGKLELVCGTAGGSAKLVAYAGTSGTAVTVLDNIGSGVAGC